MNFLAADIGATHSRLAWVHGEAVATANYRNADFTDLYQVISRFLQEQGVAGARIARMVLALPGPPDRQRMQLTNIDWQVERSQLLARYNVREVLLLNDFQAAALGAIHSSAPLVLNPAGGRPRQGTAVVTGAGTGLGLAWCADIAACALPVATEGGHADFAPVNEEQYRLHQWLAARYGHVSWERLLSGEGLRDMYQFFCGAAEQPPLASAISRAAAEGAALALQVVYCFARLMGQYAGNLALQFNPRAGVYLCGGVTAHLAPWLEQGFIAPYLDKGRMRGQARNVPVYLVREQDTGLMGAVRIARGVKNGTT